jgi:uncharacterized membrane protein YvbJ
MWRCAKCNEQIEDKYKICWNCGTKKADDVPIEKTEEAKSGDFPLSSPSERLGTQPSRDERMLIMKQEIIWLAIKGLGLYFLVVAFIGLPDLLMAVSTTYAYHNLVTSLTASADASERSARELDILVEPLNSKVPQNEDSLKRLGNSAMGAYKSLLVGPLARFILFSAAGIYLLKRGGLLFRLLNRQPNTDG